MRRHSRRRLRPSLGLCLRGRPAGSLRGLCYGTPIPIRQRRCNYNNGCPTTVSAKLSCGEDTLLGAHASTRERAGKFEVRKPILTTETRRKAKSNVTAEAQRTQRKNLG